MSKHSCVDARGMTLFSTPTLTPPLNPDGDASAVSRIPQLGDNIEVYQNDGHVTDGLVVEISAQNVVIGYRDSSGFFRSNFFRPSRDGEKILKFSDRFGASIFIS